MPRSMAPPPSSEFSITLTTPFSPSTVPTTKLEIIGEPNRPATIKHTTHTGSSSQTLLKKSGSVPPEDINELLSLVEPLAGLPSDAGKDVYGLDTRLVVSGFEVQWDNGGEEREGEVTEENRETFKGVVESLEALARMKAKDGGS